MLLPARGATATMRTHMLWLTRVRAAVMVVLLFATSVALVPAPVGRAQDAPPVPALGPAGVSVERIAPAPDWPVSGALMVSGTRLVSGAGTGLERWQGVIALTRDAGATWQVLDPPAPTVTGIALATGPDGALRAFVAALPQDSGQPQGLYWLAGAGGDGASWQPLLTWPERRERPRFVLGRDFAHDGLAFLLAGPVAFRTADGGDTWTPFAPVPGQLVRDLAFSPAYADDRTLYAAVATVTPTESAVSSGADEGAGVLVSTDAGRSWSAMAVGMEVGGLPYRQAQGLALSPTFAQDGTLFVHALGPRTEEPTPPVTWYKTAQVTRSALFRSRDRGASWEPVYTTEDRGPYARNHFLYPALSPSFAADGRVLLADTSSSGSPASSGCLLSRSGDAGTSWVELRRPRQYDSCGRPLLLPADGHIDALAVFGDGFWSLSRDDGATWEPPRSDRFSARVLVPSPAVAQDHSVFVEAWDAPTGGYRPLGVALIPLP